MFQKGMGNYVSMLGDYSTFVCGWIVCLSDGEKAGIYLLMLWFDMLGIESLNNGETIGIRTSPFATGIQDRYRTYLEVSINPF